MASYHLQLRDKPKGYALEHYFYIARLEKYQHVRVKSQEVLEHIEPGGCMPSWAKDPADFWKAADTHERANAKVYMEYELALPNELTPEQRKTLVEAFLNEHVASHQYPHSYAIHNVKSRIGGIDQPHCHLMLSLKANDGLDRTPETYFKRFNPKNPEKGGAKKRQLDEGFDNYRSFLLYIRKEWENHMNDALRQYAPTLTYQIDGQEINIPNRVSSSSYKQYNLDHGTFYIAEPKLGVGNQNNTPEYLEQIKQIREHNQPEFEREQLQKHQELNLSAKPFYSVNDQPYSSLEVTALLKSLNPDTHSVEITAIQQQQALVDPSFKNQELNLTPENKPTPTIKKDTGFNFSM